MSKCVHMARFAYVCKFCIYAIFAYVDLCKSGHVYTALKIRVLNENIVFILFSSLESRGQRLLQWNKKCFLRGMIKNYMDFPHNLITD